MDKQCRCVCSYGFTGESCQLLLHHFRYNGNSTRVLHEILVPKTEDFSSRLRSSQWTKRRYCFAELPTSLSQRGILPMVGARYEAHGYNRLQD